MRLREEDITDDLLGSTDNSADTNLYGLVRSVNPNDAFTKITRTYTGYIAQYDDWVIKAGGVNFLSVLTLFNRVIYDLDSDLDDERILEGLYDADKGEEVAAIGGRGCGDAGGFVRLFNAAVDDSMTVFFKGLPTLKDDSFAATYKHKDIAELLVATGVTLEPQLVKRRLYETGYIMSALINKQRCIATTVMLAHMHHKRFSTYKTDDREKRALYNIGSVLYTLLTFSFLIEKDTEMTRTQITSWYFFWKIFGSAMGLPLRCLPSDRGESEGLWDAFTDGGYELYSAGSVDAKKLKRVYETAMGDNSYGSQVGMLNFVGWMLAGYATKKVYWAIPGLPTWWESAARGDVKWP